MDEEDQERVKKEIHIECAPEHENILVEWADKAICYRWLHARSHMHYSTANTWFTIPIMSTVPYCQFCTRRF